MDGFGRKPAKTRCPVDGSLLLLWLWLFVCSAAIVFNWGLESALESTFTLQHILPNLITKPLMPLGPWGLVCDNENPSPNVDPLQWADCVRASCWPLAGRPHWDRGGWQPACMANKLTRDPCDNEWLRHLVSVRACDCASGQLTHCRLSRRGQGVMGAASISPQFCFSPLETVVRKRENLELRALSEE